MTPRWKKCRRDHKFNVCAKENRTFMGKVYASGVECLRAQELHVLKQAGKIKDVIEQPQFELGIPELKYKADFKVVHNDGTEIIEEVKGKETERFRLNKRLWKVYGKHPLHVLKRKGSCWERTVIIPKSMEASK